MRLGALSSDCVCVQELMDKIVLVQHVWLVPVMRICVVVHACCILLDTRGVVQGPPRQVVDFRLACMVRNHVIE